MKIGVNQFCFPSDVSVEEAIRKASDIGFDCMEICFTPGRKGLSGNVGNGVTDSLDISGYFNSLLNEDSEKADFEKLKYIASSNNLSLASIGGVLSFSIFPLTSKDKAVSERCMAAVRKMMDAAEIIGAETVMVIPGMVTKDVPYDEAYRIAIDRLAELAEYKPSVKLMIENVWNSMLYSPLEIASFIDSIGKPNVGICFDIANARRFGYPEQWIKILGNRIFEFHCKDYRMSVDTINGFTNILDGDVDYPAVLATIKDIGFDGNLIVELVPPAHYMVEDTLAYSLRTLRSLCIKGGLK